MPFECLEGLPDERLLNVSCLRCQPLNRHRQAALDAIAIEITRLLAVQPSNAMMRLIRLNAGDKYTRSRNYILYKATTAGLPISQLSVRHSKSAPYYGHVDSTEIEVAPRPRKTAL
jgi:hypothetical protein